MHATDDDDAVAECMWALSVVYIAAQPSCLPPHTEGDGPTLWSHWQETESFTQIYIYTLLLIGTSYVNKQDFIQPHASERLFVLLMKRYYLLILS